NMIAQHPQPALQRFAPVIPFDQGGSGLGEMEKSDEGEYVRLDDVAKILCFLLGDCATGPNQNQNQNL
ncbi:MAG: hypothetical protein WCK04_01075, partial [Actinomycetes bacterium]